MMTASSSSSTGAPQRRSSSSANASGSAPLNPQRRRLTGSWRLSDQHSVRQTSSIKNCGPDSSTKPCGQLQSSPGLFANYNHPTASGENAVLVHRIATGDRDSVNGTSHKSSGQHQLQAGIFHNTSREAQGIAKTFSEKLKMRAMGNRMHQVVQLNKTKTTPRKVSLSGGAAEAGTGAPGCSTAADGGEGDRAQTTAQVQVAPTTSMGRQGAAYRRSTTFHSTDLERLRTRDDGAVGRANANQNALKKHASMEDEVWDPYDNSDTDSDERRETLAEILGELEFESDQFVALPRLLPIGGLNLANTYDAKNSVVRLRYLHDSPKADRRLRQQILARIERKWAEKRKQDRRELLARKRLKAEQERVAQALGLPKQPGGTSETTNNSGGGVQTSTEASSSAAGGRAVAGGSGGSGPTGTASSAHQGLSKVLDVDDEEETRRHPYLDPIPPDPEKAEQDERWSPGSSSQFLVAGPSSGSASCAAVPPPTELEVKIAHLLGEQPRSWPGRWVRKAAPRGLETHVGPAPPKNLLPLRRATNSNSPNAVASSFLYSTVSGLETAPPFSSPFMGGGACTEFPPAAELHPAPPSAHGRVSAAAYHAGSRTTTTGLTTPSQHQHQLHPHQHHPPTILTSTLGGVTPTSRRWSRLVDFHDYKTRKKRRPQRNHLFDHTHWWQNLPFDLLPKQYRRTEAIRRKDLERGKIALDQVLFNS